MQYRAKMTFKIKMNKELYTVFEGSLWKPEREIADVIWVTNGIDSIGLNRNEFVNKFERSA